MIRFIQNPDGRVKSTSDESMSMTPNDIVTYGAVIDLGAIGRKLSLSSYFYSMTFWALFIAMASVSFSVVHASPSLNEKATDIGSITAALGPLDRETWKTFNAFEPNNVSAGDNVQ